VYWAYKQSPLSHVSLYRTKSLSRTYLYDFVCDVTRFTHLVTSHLVSRTLGSRGVRTGLQSHIPKCATHAQCIPLAPFCPFLLLCLWTLHSPDILFLFPFIFPLKPGKEFLLNFAHSCSRLAANQTVVEVGRDIDILPIFSTL